MVGGRIPKVKILSGGEIKEKINFDSCAVSKGARAKIEKVGGTIS